MIGSRFILCLIIVFSFAHGMRAEADIEQGEKLFKTYCTACHHLEMRLVGPPLKGVNERHSEEWLYSFIKSSQTMIQEGDSAAVALFNTYNKVPMPDHEMTNDEIKNILAYIGNADKPAASGDPFPRPIVERSNIKPLSFTDFRFWVLYTVTVLLVIAAVYYKAEMASLESLVSGEDHIED